jgi:hypothetical protein
MNMRYLFTTNIEIIIFLTNERNSVYIANHEIIFYTDTYMGKLRASSVETYYFFISNLSLIHAFSNLSLDLI